MEHKNHDPDSQVAGRPGAALSVSILAHERATLPSDLERPRRTGVCVLRTQYRADSRMKTLFLIVLLSTIIAMAQYGEAWRMEVINRRRTRR